MAHSNAVDLTNCDREPIHIPGSIQPQGCLLACDAKAAVVARHSANASALLELPSRELNGKKLEDLIGRKATHEVRNALARAGGPGRPGLILGLQLGDHASRFDVSAHEHDGTAIIEFEPAVAEEAPLEVVRALTARLRTITDLDELLRSAARLVRGFLAYDRVMIYKFDQDGAGEVVSEAKRGDLEGFLGLHYPASDIPRQARELYLRNTIRIIPDADAPRVPIVPEIDDAGSPLDLSYAHLRSVSPIHCEYLRNMGVGASMSVSIIVGGKLWGLVACHHYTPRSIAMAARTAAEMFGEFLSLHVEALEHKQKFESAKRARGSLDALLDRVSHHTDVIDVLHESAAGFAALLPCDGVALWLGGRLTACGSVPPPSAIPQLARFVGNASEPVWDTNALSDVLTDALSYRSEASGVLAVPLSQIPRDYLFFFRKEVIQTVTWAGNPEKPVEYEEREARLSPRKSFALWKQTVDRRSYPWTQSDRDIATAARLALIEHVLRYNELLDSERRQLEVRQKLLNQELNHRVKNILALIKALVGHPLESGRTLEEYVNSLKGRIQALAYAHDQIVRGGGALNELLEAELRPYRETAGAIEIEGPPVTLDGRAFSVLALVTHELATNAAKYGALSTRQGLLAVSWRLNPGGSCEIQWLERGGPSVSPPRHRGFGSILVDRSIPFDLGGESEVAYEAAGVAARFLIPSKFIAASPAHDAGVVGGRQEAPVVAAPLGGLKILVVEDQLVIALDMEALLAETGAAEIEIASTVPEALRKLEARSFDVAVLDVDLGEGNSIPIAEELARRRVPFVFATGYGEGTAIPAAMLEVPKVGKPCDAAGLAAALAQVLPSA